jgi:N-acyl-D-amino-acid deacylase
MFDYIVRNSTVVDGTGKQGFKADIGIKEGRILSMGRLSDSALKTIDGTGLIASPGFIDMHCHTDLELFKDTPPEAKIRQGVTTEVLGQDGLGPAPVRSSNIEVVAGLLGGLDGILPKERWTWRSFDDYLLSLNRQDLPNNTAVLVSHGAVRIDTMGMDDRDATSSELASMKQLIQDAMDTGAFGFSTGLIYPPCTYANAEELIELNKMVAEKGGIFVVHQRDEGYHLMRSFDEVVRISNESGVHLHISHLQAYGKVNWHIMDEVLKKADTFIQDGANISWDRYPYLAGSTVLSAVLPPWTFNEGPAALVERLKKPEYRARIHAEFEKGLDIWHNRQISVGWDNIIVNAVQLEKNRWMEGKSCETIASAVGENPIDMVCSLLAEENLAVTMISFYGSNSVLEKVLSHPHATVGSDGIYGGKPHPRLYGAYPRFIEDFVRDKQIFTLPEAIYKITSFPAAILGITDRGVLKDGNWADIVLFNPDTIKDTGTYEDPVHFPEGIPYVFVNGDLVIDQGRLTDRFTGKVLRK